MAIAVAQAGGAGNWDATASWDTGIVPVTGDDVIFPAGLTQPFLTNLDQSSKAAGAGVDLNLFYRDRNCSAAIGASGNPLRVGCNKLIDHGSGVLFYKNLPATLNTDLVIIDAASPNVAVELDGDRIVNLIVLRGTVTLAGTIAAMDLMQVHYRNNPDADARVTINATGSTLTELLMSGGIVTAHNAITRAIVNGGHLTKDITTITTLDVGRAGSCQYDFGGTITDARIKGILDMLKSSKKKTITNLYKFPGADVRKTDDIVTVTNSYDLTLRGA